MNPDLARLQPYPFERLAALTAHVQPPADRTPIALSIGEPQDPPPPLAADALQATLTGLGTYPATRGGEALRNAIAQWLERQYAPARIDPATQVLPVNGTREALFAIAQAVVDRSRDPATVLMPNPCYQIYEGAALLAGAEPRYYPAGDGVAPDLATIPEAEWAHCQLFYLCNPGNPTGAVYSREALAGLIERAQTHNFIIAADECYASIYPDEAQPPPGLLQVAAEAGYPDFDRCLVFHSLSKRSNLPGLRSGFVAGEAALIQAFARYRTYHGCAMSPPAQAASTAAWQDEAHVIENRARYRERFAAVLSELAGALEVDHPAGGFYLWPRVPIDDETFARELLAAENVRVVPGCYLGRTVDGYNPGADRVRMALVADTATCVEAARRIRRFIESN